MTAQHTPGPWVWRNDRYLVPADHVSRSLGFSIHEDRNRAYATVIAMPGTWGGASGEEREANARLIAAAPELLGALLVARRRFVSLAATAVLEDRPAFEAKIDEFVADINAAIAKAGAA